MNIGMVLEWGLHNDIRVQKEILSLRKAGYNVYICVPESRVEMVLQNKLRPLTPNIPIYPLLWKKKLFNFIIDKQIGVLHVHDLPLMKLGIEMGKKFGIPVVGDFHENFAEAVKVYDWAKKFPNKLFVDFKGWEDLQAWCISCLDKIIVTADEAVKYFPGAYVVDNSVDVESIDKFGFDEMINSYLKRRYKNCFVIGYTGALMEYRGLQCLLDVFPDLVGYKIKFVIVGKGKYIGHLKSIIEKHNISTMVDFYPFQPYGKLPTYIRNFDIGVTRLERSPQTDYTTPHSVFLYMYINKPVLTADSLPMKRIVEKTNSGYVYSSGNKADLMLKLKKLVRNKELGKQMGKNGHRAVLDRYNWANSSQNLLKLYKDLN